MKQLFCLFAIFLLLPLAVFSQRKPALQSNANLNFTEFLSGIKYANIACPAELQDQVDKGTGAAAFYQAGKKYLLSLGIPNVLLTTSEKIQAITSAKSYCDAATVVFSGDISKTQIGNLSLTFISCKGDIFQFQSTNAFHYKGFANVEARLLADWRSLYAYKTRYDEKARLTLPTQPTGWSEKKIREYLERSRPDPLEGIFERIRVS